MNAFPALASRRCGGPTDVLGSVRNDVIPDDRLLIEHERRRPQLPFRSQTWATSRLAVPGHLRLGTAEGLHSRSAVN